MSEVDWDDAARQWERLVETQDNPNEPKTEAQQNPYDLPGCTGLAFIASWLSASFWSGDLWLIVSALGTMLCLAWVGMKERK